MVPRDDVVGSQDVKNAATIKHKLKIPGNSDMAKLPSSFAPREAKLTEFGRPDSPSTVTFRYSLFHPRELP